MDNRDDFRVEGEDVPAPIKRKAQPPELIFHVAAVSLHKIPNHFVERFPVKIKTAFAFFRQLFFVHVLRFKPGVVGPR